LEKITKQDIKDNFYYFKSIIIFTVLLAIVYGYMTFVLIEKTSSPTYFKWLFSILVFMFILLLGAIVEILYLNHQIKKKNKDKEVVNQ